MYLLRHTDGTEFVLIDGRSYTVGRRKCDITLESKDISRNHAKIVVRNTHVFVVHLQATNQTAINGNLLNADKEYELKVGCQVKFGISEMIFSLQEDVLVVSTSGMTRENKLKVKSFVEKRGGFFTFSWSKENTHLAVDNFVLSLNTCSALICKQKIVKFQYFVDCWDCIEKSEKLPDVNKYLPSPTADMINSNKSFRFEMDRQWLFKDKTFVFPNDEWAKRMKDLIGMASGKVINIEQNRLSKDGLLKTSEREYLLVMVDVNVDPEDDSYFADCVQYVMANDRRPISLHEIPTAILDGSCDVNCNPKFNKIGHLASAKKLDIRGQILVPETQTQSVAVLEVLPGLGVHKKRVPPAMELPVAKRPCLPMSVNDNNKIKKDPEHDSAPSSNKRKINDDEDDIVAAKRINNFVKVLADLTLKSSAADGEDEKNVQVVEDSDESESENSAKTTMMTTIYGTNESSSVQTFAAKKETFREVNSGASFRCSSWMRKKCIAKDVSSTPTVNADANISFKMIFCKELSFSRLQYASTSQVNSTVNSCITMMNSTNGNRQNFKKFKKVPAHRPQTRIVSHKNLKQVTCGSGDNVDEKLYSRQKEQSATASSNVVVNVPSLKKKKQSAASKYNNVDNDDIASSSLRTKSTPQEPRTKKKGFIFNFK